MRQIQNIITNFPLDPSSLAVFIYVRYVHSVNERKGAINPLITLNTSKQIIFTLHPVFSDPAIHIHRDTELESEEIKITFSSNVTQ